jgi:hypothetical protein
LLSRFLICRLGDIAFVGNGEERQLELLKNYLPKLAMLLVTQTRRCSRYPPNDCFLHLLVPLRASTVFNVIGRTPVYNGMVSTAPPGKVTRISFLPKGRLLPNQEASFHHAVPIRLERTFISSFDDHGVPTTTDMGAMVELMKLAACQDPCGNVGEGTQTWYQGFHLVLLMHKEELDQFVNDVGGSYL